MSKNLGSSLEQIFLLALLRSRRTVAASTMIADREWQAQG